MMSSRNSSALLKPSITSSRVFKFTATPLPWLPSRGLMTTGKPISCAATQASSASNTGRPMGTGTPAACRSFFDSSLSCAMDSAMALLKSVSAAWMRRCLLPQPNCTKLPSDKRRNGMPRAKAASTMDPVEGPKRRSSSSSRNASSALSTSKPCALNAAKQSCSAKLRANLPTCSTEYSTTT